jgi:hypothetical protein
MILDNDLVLEEDSVAELLVQASARTGFSLPDIEAMVECELEISQLLDYITAVISNRMN